MSKMYFLEVPVLKMLSE